MWDIFFGNGFGSYPRLDSHSEEVRRDSLLDLLANRLTIIKSLLLMKKESQGIHWVSHYVNDYLHNI